MNNRILTLYLLLFIFVATGCHHRIDGKEGRLALELQDDTENTLKAYNARSEELLPRQAYDSIIAYSREILRRYPARPHGNPDSLREETRKLLRFYILSCCESRQVSENAALTDSMLAAGHPYLCGKSFLPDLKRSPSSFSGNREVRKQKGGSWKFSDISFHIFPLSNNS